MVKKLLYWYQRSPENRKREYSRNQKWRNADLRRELIHAAKNRARRKNLPFDITVDDLIIPKRCPILGLELRKGAGKTWDGSPSLDRIIPNKGYVPGNVSVISYAANRLKSNMDKKTLKRLYKYVFDTKR